MSNIRRIRIFITAAVILIGMGFLNCGNQDPQSPNDFDGSLLIYISGGESISPVPVESSSLDIKSKINSVDRISDLIEVPDNIINWNAQAIDSVIVKIFVENWVLISSTRLERIDDNTYRGSISVPSGKDINATAEVWQASTLLYFAIETGIRVEKGATRDLPMTAYKFYPDLIVPTSIQSGPIDLWWTSIDNASSYLLEQDTDITFSGDSRFYRSYQITDTSSQVPTDTSAVYYFRVRAQRAGPNPPSTPSALDSVIVVKENRFTVGRGSGASPSGGNLVPVMISNNTTIAALQFDIVYDGSKLSTPVPVVTVPGDRLISGGGMVAADTLNYNTTRYVIYSTKTLDLLPPGVGVVCSLSFDVSSGQIAQMIPLTIENLLISDKNGDPLSFNSTNGTFNIE